MESLIKCRATSTSLNSGSAGGFSLNNFLGINSSISLAGTSAEGSEKPFLPGEDSSNSNFSLIYQNSWGGGNLTKL